MTSSLVGSEMCIRDSLLVVVVVAAVAVSVVVVDVVIVVHVVDVPVADAVSYTHLTLPTICSV
eukprot:10999011-Prorocentrum_lima.AAC.1